MGCYRTASAGSALGSFCPCLLWLPSLPPALSGGTGCSLWAGQLASAHSHSLLIYIYLEFYCPVSGPSLKLVTFFQLNQLTLYNWIVSPNTPCLFTILGLHGCSNAPLKETLFLHYIQAVASCSLLLQTTKLLFPFLG